MPTLHKKIWVCVKKIMYMKSLCVLLLETQKDSLKDVLG